MVIESGRILVADDEETFSRSTAYLLRREGYQCDYVLDGQKAVETLRSRDYDLLIADIKMPGNPQLQLIRELPNIAEGMPAIIVTGYPSLKSAILSIQLPVTAYLVKPFDFGELLAQVQASIKRARIYRTICRTRQNLEEWHRDLADIEAVMVGTAESDPSEAACAFLELTLQNIVGALSDIRYLTEAFTMRIEQGYSQPCHLLNCPKLSMLKEVLIETIEVLEKTRTAFKSKDLGMLRHKLEGVFKTVLR